MNQPLSPKNHCPRRRTKGRRLALVLGLAAISVACGDGKDVYFKQIEELGFIPYAYPVEHASSGTMLRGKPSALTTVSDPQRCLPDAVNGDPTNLRWQSAIDVPALREVMNLSFDARLNSIVTLGNPVLSLNTSARFIKTVELTMRDTSIQFLDQLELRDYYQDGMSADCQQAMSSFPFVLEALKVGQMKFVFKTESGGHFGLSVDNIESVVDISANVRWRIDNGFELIVETPKYIGYKLSQLKAEDGGLVNSIATKVSNDAFVWESLAGPSSLATTHDSNIRSLRSAQPDSL